jgi:mannose-6-phosphate isomerase
MSNRYKVGDEDTRPWGHWIVLDVGDRHTVKRITVTPGSRLSLQYHRCRDEFWTCVAGEGLASVGGTEIPLMPTTAVFVPQSAVHRITNTGYADLIVIETQIGHLLDENDIVHVEDDFGRC